MAVSIFLLILIPLILIIPILVGVYVYRDADKRGMNAVLWLLIAILTPSLLGLIIYLLVRNNYSDLTCPNCNTRVEESYVVCPNCRTKLRPTRDVCSAPIQTTWKVCPHCGSDLPQYSMDVAAPVRAKDNTLGKILIAILIVPVAIILLIILLTSTFGAVKQSGGYATGFFAVSMDKFLENQPENTRKTYTDLFDSIASSSDQSCVFVYEADAMAEHYDYQYLVYIPGAGGYQNMSHSIETKGFFNKTYYWDLNITDDRAGEEQQLYIFEYNGTFQPPQDFGINYNGQEREITYLGSVDTPFLESFHTFDMPVDK